MNIQEWQHLLVRRFQYRIVAQTNGVSVTLIDCDGNTHWFEPHPATLKPEELAMLTRRFLRARDHIIDGTDEDAA